MMNFIKYEKCEITKWRFTTSQEVVFDDVGSDDKDVKVIPLDSLFQLFRTKAIISRYFAALQQKYVSKLISGI